VALVLNYDIRGLNLGQVQERLANISVLYMRWKCFMAKLALRHDVLEGVATINRHCKLRLHPLLQAANMHVLHGAFAVARRDEGIPLLAGKAATISKTDSANFTALLVCGNNRCTTVVVQEWKVRVCIGPCGFGRLRGAGTHNKAALHVPLQMTELLALGQLLRKPFVGDHSDLKLVPSSCESILLLAVADAQSVSIHIEHLRGRV
jgi:hypothetical protein